METPGTLSGVRTAGLAVATDELPATTTRRVEFVDLTEAVARWVEGSGVSSGLVHVQSLHTTTGVILNEHEPRLLEDFRRQLERWAPRAAPWRHNDLAARPEAPPDERPNADAHLRALLLGSSQCLGLTAGRLHLGRWQRLFLVELDGPRRRRVGLHAIGAGEECAR